MTKKDGDKLRAMKAELEELAHAYAPAPGAPTSRPVLSVQLGACALAIESTLRGRAFDVIPIDPGIYPERRIHV